MRFSIIIPAYNAADRIRKALDSVAMQTFKDYELIVICDSCLDKTQEIANSYGAITEKHNFHNDGLSRSRGLDIAKGEYVLFMDDDDWWMREDMLQLLDAKIDSCNQPDVICFSFHFQHIGYADPHGLNGERWIATWNKCWKRSAVGDTRFPNVYSCSDRYFHDEMMKKDLTIVDYPECFYYYNYLREGSISQQQGNTIEGTKKVLHMI